LGALPLTQIKNDPPVGAELSGLICIKRDRNEWGDSDQVERTIQMSTQRRAFTPNILSILIISNIVTSFPALADTEGVRCTLHKRYPVETLEDALGEGLSTGHPRMPEFRLDPGEVGDFISFLKSLE